MLLSEHDKNRREETSPLRNFGFMSAMQPEHHVLPNDEFSPATN
jgi:hypothetical protein